MPLPAILSPTLSVRTSDGTEDRSYGPDYPRNTSIPMDIEVCTLEVQTTWVPPPLITGLETRPTPFTYMWSDACAAVDQIGTYLPTAASP